MYSRQIADSRSCPICKVARAIGMMRRLDSRRLHLTGLGPNLPLAGGDGCSEQRTAVSVPSVRNRGPACVGPAVGSAELGQRPRGGGPEPGRQALNRCGNDRQLNVSAMVIRDRSQAKRARYAPAVGLAVTGKREHRLQQPLETQGRSNLAKKSGADVAGVPKRVCRVPAATSTVSPALRPVLRG